MATLTSKPAKRRPSPSREGTSIRAIGQRGEERPPGLGVGEEAARAVPDSVAVVPLVQQVAALERKSDALDAMLDLRVQQAVRRHLARESVRLVVVVALRADVARVHV